MMRTKFEKFKDGSLFMLIVMLLCTVFGFADASVITADVVTGESGVTVQGSDGEVNTRAGAEEVTDSLIRKTIEKEVVKIKPHLFAAATVASANTKRIKHSNNPEYEYQSIETLPTITTVKTAYTGSGAVQDSIDFADNKLIAINETIVVPSVPGYKSDGTTLDGQFLILNVINKDNSGKPIVVPINGVKSGSTLNTLPSLTAGIKVIRGARTGTEKQIRTDLFSAVPTPSEQYLQKFIIETEESTYFEMADKEVKWGKTEITDMALFEYKLTQNTDFWLGRKEKRKVANKYNEEKEDMAWFMEGIWWQAGKDFSFGSSTITTQDLVAMMKKAFVGNASSSTKILFAGSDLIESLQNVQYNQVIYVGSRKQAMGLEFSSIISNYGTLLIYHDQSLNDIGFDANGLIVDPDYFEKITMGWREKKWDHGELAKSDSKGQVFYETCALVMKNSKAHMRVTTN